MVRARRKDRGARGALAFAVTVLCLALAPAPAKGDPDPQKTTVRATLTCERAVVPGRIRCDAELRAKEGAVRWADVEILAAPDFILPLKGRVGPRDATTREDDVWRWGLGLVAKDRGEGDVLARLRAVVCHAERCATETAEARAHVVVGRPSER